MNPRRFEQQDRWLSTLWERLPGVPELVDGGSIETWTPRAFTIARRKSDGRASSNLESAAPSPSLKDSASHLSGRDTFFRTAWAVTQSAIVANESPASER